ncbi:PQQ-binding-like beta-propeller repeat protein [Streptomyces sp. INA 01156]
MVADVTYERILNAREEPQNWLTYYGAYDGQRYSPLDQINTENVKRLAPAWVFQAGTTGLIAGASTYSFEAAPVVVDGIMFVSGWDGWLWAVDAKTGVEIWRYKHAVPFDVSLCCGNVNRGVAVAQGRSSSSRRMLVCSRSTPPPASGSGTRPTETSGPRRAPRSPRWS